MFEYFRHQILKNVVAGFGTLFNDIYIARFDASGNELNRVRVPFTYGPKQKFLVRLNQSDKNLVHNFQMTLPRMSFEITNIAYDADRKLPTTHKVVSYLSSDSLEYRFERVPYNLDLAVNIMTKNTEDAFQILEQILPYFTPELTITFKSFPVESQLDVPISIGTISFDDQYEGDFEDRKVFIITINFSASIQMYGPVKTGGVITRTISNFIDIDTFFVAGVTGTPSGNMVNVYGTTGGTFANVFVDATGGATAGSIGPTGTYDIRINEF